MLFAECRLLFVASCPLLVVCCILFAVWLGVRCVCSLCVVCRLLCFLYIYSLFVVCCLWRVGCAMLFAVRRSLSVACCLLVDVCCLLVVGSLLFVVC